VRDLHAHCAHVGHAGFAHCHIARQKAKRGLLRVELAGLTPIVSGICRPFGSSGSVSAQCIGNSDFAGQFRRCRAAMAIHDEPNGRQIPEHDRSQTRQARRESPRFAFPGYMTMGETGMADMGTMGMKVPHNSLPMVGGVVVRLHHPWAACLPC